jgi:hypothetical protein
MNCIDLLTYRSYEAQRINSPHIEYKRWGILFANVELLETFYQGMNNEQHSLRKQSTRISSIFEML